MKQCRLIVVLLMALCLSACAADPGKDNHADMNRDYRYVLLEDGTVEITRYTGEAETLIVPETLGGYRVTGIASDAFYHCDTLLSITIPDSVTQIGANPFVECLKLTTIRVNPSHPVLATIDGVLFNKVTKELICYPYDLNNISYTIPNGILSIGDHAFDFCEGLAYIMIPDSVTSIGDYAFSSCGSLRNIAIPDSVASVGESAFFCCSALTSITLPAGLTSIEKDAFHGCSSMTNITIPDGVTSIGNGAFSGCESLTAITIPDSVVWWDGNPFAGCNKLASINVNATHPVLETVDGVLFNKTTKELICCPGAFAAANYVVPLGILGIGDDAFSGCDLLMSITIPNSVVSIGDRAFGNCDSLTSITIPDGVTSIGHGAFGNCDSLTSITIPDGVTSIGNWAFSGCDSLTSITLPGGITYISENTFYECDSLTSIILPDNVTSIENWAFYGCTSLEKVKVPTGVTRIGEYAFLGCSETLCFIVTPESYAEQWCRDNNRQCIYTSSSDWLLN